MSDTLVHLHDVNLAFGDKAVLQHINLSISRKKITTLVGPNGAGKTTLARVILGLQAPTSGRVERATALRVGYMPQKIKLDDSLPLTVDRFLWLAAPGRTRDRREALAQTDVAHLRRRAVQQLSGGELQRVLLARALLRKPDLLVLDEPAQGVDVTGQSALYGLLAQLRDNLNCGIVLISHDLHLVMAATDEVICLQHHICCSGSPETVSRHPAYHKLFQHDGMDARHLAVYTHSHDHDHNLHGDVCHNESDCAAPASRAVITTSTETHHD